MTFRTGHKSPTPWRSGNIHGTALRTCAGCGRTFPKPAAKCRSANDCCSPECVQLHLAKCRAKRAGA